jgi:hypothetical protein
MFDPQLLDAPSWSDSAAIETPDHQNVLSPLVTAYHERGYEAGYSRGVNDSLAAILEAAEEFARLQPGSSAEIRQLLFAFSEFLEDQIGRTPPHSDNGFVDGLGI